MKIARSILAVSAVAAVVSVLAVVAFAAPQSLGRAASPSGGAAAAVYCPPAVKKQLQSAVLTFRKQMLVARKRYFASHPKAKQRVTFVKLQNQQLNALVRRFAKCS